MYVFHRFLFVKLKYYYNLRDIWNPGSSQVKYATVSLIQWGKKAEKAGCRSVFLTT